MDNQALEYMIPSLIITMNKWWSKYQQVSKEVND
jgi:hypothetical protein